MQFFFGLWDLRQRVIVSSLKTSAALVEVVRGQHILRTREKGLLSSTIFGGLRNSNCPSSSLQWSLTPLSSTVGWRAAKQQRVQFETKNSNMRDRLTATSNGLKSCLPIWSIYFYFIFFVRCVRALGHTRGETSGDRSERGCFSAFLITYLYQCSRRT